jgi:hypothetical protein
LIGASDAAELERFFVGDWQGSAYSDDATGKFSHCGIGSQYVSGHWLHFGVLRDFSLALSVSDDRWSLVPGEAYPVRLLVDMHAPVDAVAKAITSHQAVIQFPDPGRVYDLFRRGYVLRIVTQGSELPFELTGSYRALARAAECTRLNLEREYASARSASNPFLSGPATADPADPDTMDRGTLLVLMVNILNQTGVTGYRLLSVAETAEIFGEKFFGVGWIAEDTLGTAAAVKTRVLGVEDIASLIVSRDGKSCGGKFVSGIIPDTSFNGLAPTRRIFTACAKSSDSWWAEYALIDDGEYLYNFSLVTTLGGESEPRDGAGSDDAFYRSAVLAVVE